MTSLKSRARLALEGSDRSEDALRSLVEYIDDVTLRVVDELACTNIDGAVELLVLLRGFRRLADPDDDAPYRMQIVKRKPGPGAPPNPAVARRRRTNAMLAASYADGLLERDPSLMKKAANGRAAEAYGVTVGEIYRARKDPIFIERREARLNSQQEKSA